MEIAYYPGCSLKQSSQLYDLQTRLVFEKVGIKLNEIDDWNCCGATSAEKIDDFLKVAMPARNIGIAEDAGFKEIIIPCSACYCRTLIAQKYICDDINLKQEINDNLSKKIKGDLKITSIVDALVDKFNKEHIKEEIINKIGWLKPVCYYGCLLTRFSEKILISDNVENPQGMETILGYLGIKSLDWNYKTYCCGASASVNDEQVSMKLMSKIMQDALDRGANCFVVSCPMCQMNLDVYQDAFCDKYGIESRIPVFFITEILGIAMGISPEQLQIDRHFILSDKLLKELD